MARGTLSRPRTRQSHLRPWAWASASVIPAEANGRVGEGDARHRGVVDAPSGVLEGVLNRERSLLGRDVDELRVAGDVASGPDARVGCAHVGVDDHLAGGSDSDPYRVEAEPLGAGLSASGNQQLLGAELALGGRHNHLVAVSAGFDRDGVLDDGDAVARECGTDGVGDLGLFAACES
jgi:hypothetical protein